MSGLLAWVLGMLVLTGIGLVLAQRWLDKKDEEERDERDT